MICQHQKFRNFMVYPFSNPSANLLNKCCGYIRSWWFQAPWPYVVKNTVPFAVHKRNDGKVTVPKTSKNRGLDLKGPSVSERPLETWVSPLPPRCPCLSFRPPLPPLSFLPPVARCLLALSTLPHGAYLPSNHCGWKPTTRILKYVNYDFKFDNMVIIIYLWILRGEQM